MNIKRENQYRRRYMENLYNTVDGSTLNIADHNQITQAAEIPPEEGKKIFYKLQMEQIIQPLGHEGILKLTLHGLKTYEASRKVPQDPTAQNQITNNILLNQGKIERSTINCSNIPDPEPSKEEPEHKSTPKKTGNTLFRAILKIIKQISTKPWIKFVIDLVRSFKTAITEQKE